MRTVRAEHFATAGADVGEGPVWDPRDASLAWVDITAGEVHRHAPDGAALVTLALGQHVGAVLPARTPGYLIAGRAGWSFLTPEGKLEPIDLPIDGDPGIRFNDAKCDPRGRAFGGTMAYDVQPGRGVLYRLDPGPTSTPVLDGLTISNGLGWSPDEKTMYFIDSGSQAVTAYRYDIDSGEPTDPRTLVTFDRARDGMPDGLTVDADGCLWVALWGGAQIRRYTPQGKLDVVVELPVTQPTSVAFIGTGLDTLVITTAKYQLTEGQLAAEPLAGDLFAVSGLATGVEPALWHDLRNRP